MQTTLNLIEKAEEVKNLSVWARELGLSRQSIHNAKYRGNLSPAIAGALAERLGEPVDQWIVIAALESEKDSACKDLMLKRLKRKSPHGAGSKLLERAMGIEPTS